MRNASLNCFYSDRSNAPSDYYDAQQNEVTDAAIRRWDIKIDLAIGDSVDVSRAYTADDIEGIVADWQASQEEIVYVDEEFSRDTE